MNIMPRLKLLGTSHVAEQSVKEIILEIDVFQPNIVAVELDKNRLHALLNNQKTSLHPKLILHIGLWGYLFALVGQFVQQRIGKNIGILPGSDMLTAIKYAKIKEKKIALIDQNIQITLKKVSKKFSLKDKWNLFCDIIEGVFFRKKAEKKMKKIMGNLDLKKVPEKEVVVKMISLLENRYPGLYEALVEDRNHIMSTNVKGLMRKFPEEKILVVVGAGHIKGMEKILKKELKEKVEEKNV